MKLMKFEVCVLTSSENYRSFMFPKLYLLSEMNKCMAFVLLCLVMLFIKYHYGPFYTLKKFHILTSRTFLHDSGTKRRRSKIPISGFDYVFPNQGLSRLLPTFRLGLLVTFKQETSGD